MSRSANRPIRDLGINLSICSLSLLDPIEYHPEKPDHATNTNSCHYLSIALLRQQMGFVHIEHKGGMQT
jgi:hypothetical protein